jgi:hypothetical protein
MERSKRNAKNKPMTARTLPQEPQPVRLNLRQGEAAAALGISTGTIRRWTRLGRLRPVMLGSVPTYPVSVLAKIASRGMPTLTEKPKAAR